MEEVQYSRQFYQFFEENYHAEILEKARKGENFLHVDFAKLVKFEPELAEDLLENPEEVIRNAELSFQEFDIENIARFKVRFFNLPLSQRIMISNIRSEHIGKFLVIEGIVRQKSDVRPQVVSARFECPACGNIIPMLQLESAFREPSRCSCGRKGKFVLLGKELVDAQKIVLEEAHENLEGGEQPKRINIFLKDDLVSPISEKRSAPGNKIRMTGLIKEVPITLNSAGTKSVRFDLQMEANNCEPIDETFYDLVITPEEEEIIKKLGEDQRILNKLSASIAPSVFGYEKIKEALVLQMMGGVHKISKDGTLKRGDIHVLLVGDPGAGKSMLLKRINLVAPKSRYISGKGISAAGLTASVVKDEFLRGWSLEAGAMVLASNGLCCIDELDKMSREDTSAMHEALENQSYHPDTEIMLSDGSVFKIGRFVDELIENNRANVIQGKDCEILPVKDIELLTTDFEGISPIKAKMVSRHKAPEYFIKISYSNGRSITVTPEHPVFVFSDGKIKEIPGESIKPGLLAPAPRKLPTKSKDLVLVNGELNHFNNKDIYFPLHLNNNYARLLGYITTEGHAYFSQANRYAEVGISNTNPLITDETSLLFKETFKTTVNINVQPAYSRLKAKKDLKTVRLSSVPFYRYICKNFRGSVNGARKKYIDNTLRCAEKDLQLEFLRTAFKGDGFVDSTRFGFSTSSFELAKGYQDLLLQNFILSKIDIERKDGAEYYKVTVTGTESFKIFIENIVEKDDDRLQRLIKSYDLSKKKKNERDILPREVLIEVNSLLKSFRLSDGYFYNNINRGFNAHRRVVLNYIKKIEGRINRGYRLLNSEDIRRIRRMLNIEVDLLSKNLGVSAGTIYNIEKSKSSGKYTNLLSVVRKFGKERICKARDKINNVLKLINSDIRFVYIKKIERINNDNIKWVYDVTVEPTRTFISEGLVLHNTVSISKANIQATLIARTTVLAAANPKLGRFDQYGIIADQIDLPPALINRFDLIFPIKDLPNKESDEMMASHILNLHYSPDKVEQEIPTKLLKKYIAYAKQKFEPKLTEGAIEEIKSYYLKMRLSGGGEEGIRTIPISARQLDALIRLSEASARVRLSEKVTRKDAKKAIELLEYCLMQVGFDKETGKIDIDRIATGVGASQRSNIITIKEIMDELEGSFGKQIPIQEIVEAAKEKGIDDSKTEEVIDKLKRSGDVFEPKRGYLQKIG